MMAAFQQIMYGYKKPPYSMQQLAATERLYTVINISKSIILFAYFSHPSLLERWRDVMFWKTKTPQKLKLDLQQYQVQLR